MTYQEDRNFADNHFSAISHAIKSVAAKIIEVKVAPDQDDKERATDYVITADIGTIGCRIRRSGTRKSYKDMTIRYARASGAETEYSKIIKGYPRWYLYAWSDGNDAFEAWAFIDMDCFRKSGLLDDVSRRVKYNRDGRTSFVYYNMKELASVGAIIGSGGVMCEYLSNQPTTIYL